MNAEVGGIGTAPVRSANAATGDATTAQTLDWAFYATIVEAARNLVLGLVMNSIRHVYFQRADLFAKVVDDHQELAPLYAEAAAAIASRKPDGAASAVKRLAQQQAERLAR